MVKDVEDLEAIRRHFGVDRFVPVGFSYLGFMVVLYAMEHPHRVERLVQLGPVPRKFGSDYPASLLHEDSVPVVDPAAAARLDSLHRTEWAQTHQRELCERSREVFAPRLVGRPERIAGLMDQCGMENEWPMNLRRHLDQVASLGSESGGPYESSRCSGSTCRGRRSRGCGCRC